MKLLLSNILIFAVFLPTLPLIRASTQCRCFPGDSCWPSKADWANQSCDPFTANNDPCVIGTYVQYAVNTTSSSDVIKTIAFAKNRNIRLVVRNTGHDYLGKSTGAGALAIWTHQLKDFDVVHYQSSTYKGKAVKIGAGVLSSEATAKAHEKKLVVVSGGCPTVGISGGYTQGGGFGPLTSRYGMAADQVLEWETVTVEGDLMTANLEKNTDLFWALSGGGGGTYAIVLSMTVKAYPETRVASANLTFTNSGVSQEQFYDAVNEFHSCIPTLSDAGAVAIWEVTNATFGLAPATGPGMTKRQMDEVLLPVVDKLKSLNISYSKAIEYSSQYNIARC
jgi:FAD/FMN-containing dehydrogenase